MARKEEDKSDFISRSYIPYGEPVVLNPANTAPTLCEQQQNPFPGAGANVEEVRIIIHQTTKEKICRKCNKSFSKYDLRNGIHIGFLVMIIILSCFMFVFLYLFLCLCDQYRVCPNCHQFTGDERSNNPRICLC